MSFLNMSTHEVIKMKIAPNLKLYILEHFIRGRYGAST